MKVEELSRLSDREILLLLIERFDGLKESHGELKSEIGTLGDRITVLERKADKQSGFLDGANWLKNLLLLGGGGLAATIFGDKLPK